MVLAFKASAIVLLTLAIELVIGESLQSACSSAFDELIAAFKDNVKASHHLPPEGRPE